jgi:hypothetical protein
MTTKTANRSLSTAALVKRLAQECTDAGWIVTQGIGYTDGNEIWNDSFVGRGHYLHAMLKVSDTLFVRIALNVFGPTDAWDRKRAVHGKMVTGHTCMSSTGEPYSWASFTRRGIDVDSCSLVPTTQTPYSHQYHNVVALLLGETERCLRARAASDRSVQVPGLPYSLSPERLVNYKRALANGESVTLAPHGMGVAHRISTKRFGFAEAHTGPLAEFFGQRRVFVTTLDWD